MADRPYLAGLFQIVQGPPDVVVDLMGAEGRVKKENVDSIGTEPLEAFLDRFRGPPSVEMCALHRWVSTELGRNDCTIAIGAQALPEDAFRHPVLLAHSIEGRCIEKIDTKIKSRSDGANRFTVVDLAINPGIEGPGSEADLADFQSGSTEGACIHWV